MLIDGLRDTANECFAKLVRSRLKKALRHRARLEGDALLQMQVLDRDAGGQRAHGTVRRATRRIAR